VRGGFDIAVTEEAFSGNEDRRWMGARKGADTCRSVTLDVSTFAAVHVTTGNGGIPSGTVLAKITASGKYGPYDPAAADGREIEANCLFLFSKTKVGDGSGADLATAADVGAAGLWEGIIKESRLPAFAGTVAGELHADVKAAMTHCRFEA
jgi:hypothetical protein